MALARCDRVASVERRDPVVTRWPEHAMRQRLLLVDAGLGVALAVLVLVLAPGLAVAAIIAIGVLLVMGVTYAVGARRSRARRSSPSRPLWRR